MFDDQTWAQINGQYECPADAGPAWRAAVEVGYDMSLVEHALALTPEQRLAEHQQVVEFLLSVQEAGSSNGAE